VWEEQDVQDWDNLHPTPSLKWNDETPIAAGSSGSVYDVTAKEAEDDPDKMIIKRGED